MDGFGLREAKPTDGRYCVETMYTMLPDESYAKSYDIVDRITGVTICVFADRAVADEHCKEVNKAYHATHPLNTWSF